MSYYGDVTRTAVKLVKHGTALAVGSFVAGALVNETRHAIQDAERNKEEFKKTVSGFMHG